MLVIYIHFRREQWPRPFFFFCRRDQKNNYSVSIIIVFCFVFFPSTTSGGGLFNNVSMIRAIRKARGYGGMLQMLLTDL